MYTNRIKYCNITSNEMFENIFKREKLGEKLSEGPNKDQDNICQYYGFKLY